MLLYVTDIQITVCSIRPLSLIQPKTSNHIDMDYSKYERFNNNLSLGLKHAMKREIIEGGS